MRRVLFILLLLLATTAEKDKNQIHTTTEISTETPTNNYENIKSSSDLLEVTPSHEYTKGAIGSFIETSVDNIEATFRFFIDKFLEVTGLDELGSKVVEKENTTAMEPVDIKTDNTNIVRSTINARREKLKSSMKFEENDKEPELRSVEENDKVVEKKMNAKKIMTKDLSSEN